MTLKERIATYVVAQGNQVGSGSELAAILNDMVDMIPAAQVQSDYTQADNTKPDYIKNKPALKTVATSGSYNDLTDKPTIPAALLNIPTVRAGEITEEQYMQLSSCSFVLFSSGGTGSESLMSRCYDSKIAGDKLGEYNAAAGFLFMRSLEYDDSGTVNTMDGIAVYMDTNENYTVAFFSN